MRDYWNWSDEATRGEAKRVVLGMRRSIEWGMETKEQGSPVVALVKDLIFSTKIAATARAAGVPVRIVREAERLGGEAGRLLLVDLNQPGAIVAGAAWGREQNRPVVGFVSHVDADTIAAARAVGITQVLARSRFVEVLPELLNP